MLLYFNEDGKIIYNLDESKVDMSTFTRTTELSCSLKLNGDDNTILQVLIPKSLYMDITKKGYKKHLTNEDLTYLFYYSMYDDSFKNRIKTLFEWIKSKLFLLWHAGVNNKKVTIDLHHQNIWKQAELDAKKYLKKYRSYKSNSSEIRDFILNH